MKIIIIGPAYPFRGGIADTNESFCRALVAKKQEASIITFKLQYPEFLFPGKTQLSTDPRPKGIKITQLINTINPISWINTARKINAIKPQLVVVRYWLPFMAPCLGSIVRLLSKDITLIAMCDNVIPHEKRIGDQMLTKYFVNSFHGFVTLSKTVCDELEQFTDKPKIYFPHPINDNLGEKVAQKEARKHLKLDAKGKYILFFGLVRKYKGLDLLLKAMGNQKLKDLDVKLIIAGEFYDSPDEYYDIIKQYGIENRVEIRNMYIPTSDIKYYFSAVDLVTQTYHTASQSGVTQIAFNFDCPILVTKVGGLSEIVLHDEVGYVTSKEPVDIAKSIADFYEKEKKNYFVENIKKEKVKYSWESFSDAVIQLYEEISTVEKN